MRQRPNKITNQLSRPIIVGHLEKINSKIFDQNRNLITEMIRGHYGIYALYRREKLYYVGLATDLRKRLNQHLTDRHKGKWTHFSLYILRKAEHLRETETLVLRIADPTGNEVKGKLERSKNLLPELKTLLTEDFKARMDEILGVKKMVVKRSKKSKRKAILKRGELPLRGLLQKGSLRHGQGIYSSYKGKTYKAVVYHSGIIKLQGKTYESPSAAAKAIIDRGQRNGWKFWKYKNKSGELVPLSELKE